MAIKHFGVLEVCSEGDAGFGDSTYGFQVYNNNPLGSSTSICLDHITPSDMINLAKLMQERLDVLGITEQDVILKRDEIRDNSVSVCLSDGFQTHEFWNLPYNQDLICRSHTMKALKFNFNQKPYDDSDVQVSLFDVYGSYIGFSFIPKKFIIVLE